MFVASKVYKDCVVEIDGVTMTANLIPLDIQEFDVILGMNFLSKYRATMDCFQKEVVFRGFEGTEVIFRGDRKVLPTCVISAVKARKLLGKGCSAYLAYVVDAQASK